MRLPILLLSAAALCVVAAPAAAQRGRTPTSSANANRPETPRLPNGRVVTAGLNPAAYLIDKRRKLQLDEPTLTALRTLEATLNERYAERLTRYDSLRAQVDMARNRMSGAMEPSEEERQIGRERTIVLGRVMSELREQREADLAEVLAALPEDKRAAAQELFTEQAEGLARALRRAGPEGAAAAGGGGREGGTRRP